MDAFIQISGVYPAISMDDQMECKNIKHKSWSSLIRSVDPLHCFFLPDAMFAHEEYLPSTKQVTDPIIIEQDSESITVNYVNHSDNYMKLSLRRGEDYQCRGNKVMLLVAGDDIGQMERNGIDSDAGANSLYKGVDGSLVYEFHTSSVQTFLLPPFIKSIRTSTWARWPRLPDPVPDVSMRIKTGFLKYSKEAVERGDMEAAYRLLEDYLGSDDKEFKDLSLQFFVDNPRLKEAALNTFSIQSLEETQSDHGERAKAIEETRLEIYKTIARESEYQQARKNFEKVFER